MMPPAFRQDDLPPVSPIPVPAAVTDLRMYRKRVRKYFAHLPWVVDVTGGRVVRMQDLNYFARFYLVSGFEPLYAFLSVHIRKG